MKDIGQKQKRQGFSKKYTVAIDTVPMPEHPAKRIELVMKAIGPVINHIVFDAMTVAIGTWPTPEKRE
jgi:hypothetical protein